VIQGVCSHFIEYHRQKSLSFLEAEKTHKQAIIQNTGYKIYVTHYSGNQYSGIHFTAGSSGMGSNLSKVIARPSWGQA
jgi:hypothetical protein